MLSSSIYNLFNSILDPLIKGVGSGLPIEDHLILKARILDFLKKDKRFSNNLLRNILLLLTEDPSAKQVCLNFQEFKEHLMRGMPLDLLAFEEELEISDVESTDGFDHAFRSITYDNNFTEMSWKMREIFYQAKYIKTSSDEENVKMQLDAQLNEDEWGTLSSFQWGISYILFTSVELTKNSPSIKNMNYLESCGERVLRKLEIGRSQIINFINAPKEKQSLLLEQLKIIYFCLKVCEETLDLRFLNGALKANDRIFKSVKSTLKKKSLDIIDIEVLIFYVLNLGKQEKLFDKLV